MTRKVISNQRPAASTIRLPAALLVAATLSCLCAQTYAEEPARSSRSKESVSARQAAADLEKEFWACDHAATTRGVWGEEGALCGEVYENLKKSKFGGDFQVMLSWWQRNKTVEHQALAAASRMAAGPRADQVTSR